jgi:carboxymethylenebutenolidase
MVEKEIAMRTRDGLADGVLFQPEKDGKWPGIIHLTDIFGIRQASRAMAKRIAAAGYVLVQPNVFYRTAKPPVFDFPFTLGDERFTQRVRELTGALTPEAIERDGVAYVEFLAKQSCVSGQRFGTVGYCFTGAMALRIAAACPEQIAAAASFHGGYLYTDGPRSPHTLLPRVKARLYFGHGIEDRSMPQEAIEKFNRALKDWGGQYTSEIYEGTHHGWTVPDNHAYDHAQAERAFGKMMELFDTVLKAQSHSRTARS